MEESRRSGVCTEAQDGSNQMDDWKHHDAVLAAAEIFEHAHKLSASSSSKVPAERALTVDAVMEVAGTILWPDSDRAHPLR